MLTINREEPPIPQQIVQALSCNLPCVVIGNVDERLVLLLCLVKRVRPYQPLPAKVGIERVVGQGAKGRLQR